MRMAASSRSLWDLGGENHPAITSMREHRGFLYLGGVTNNRIGRIRLAGADPGLDGPVVLLGELPMNPLRKAVDSWFGRGEASITIPPMDGAFRPNDLLDLAPLSLEAPAPDCLAATSHGAGRLLGPFASQRRQVRRRGARVLRDADQRSGRLAGWRRGGGLDRRQDRFCRRRVRRNDGPEEPRGRLHHRARAGFGRDLVRRQRLGERTGRGRGSAT